METDRSEAERCYFLGREAYPELRWDFTDFEEVWLAYGEQAPSLGNSSPDDYIRLGSLANLPEAQAIFDRDYLKPLAGPLSRICGDGDAVWDVLQGVREKLLLSPHRKLEDYKSRGSFRAWLRVVATRAALDAVKARGGRQRKERELAEVLGEVVVGPETEALHAESRVLFQKALHAAVAELTDADRRILRFHLVSGWGVTQVGRVLGVHRATAARWLVQARGDLQRRLLRRLGAELETQEASVRKWLEQVQSQLDVRLSQVFPKTSTWDFAAAESRGAEEPG